MKWLDFWYVLMIRLIGFVDELDVIQDKGELSIVLWCFVRRIGKIELLLSWEIQYRSKFQEEDKQFRLRYILFEIFDRFLNKYIKQIVIYIGLEF